MRACGSVPALRYVFELDGRMPTGEVAYVPLDALPGVRIDDVVRLVEPASTVHRDGVVVLVGRRDVSLRLGLAVARR
jgi:hypothetical protein